MTGTTKIHGLDDLAGYVVRVTVDMFGERIERGSCEPELPGNCQIGRDVAVVDGAGSYGRALEAAKAIRACGKAWAVVDPVYTNGDRGMA